MKQTTGDSISVDPAVRAGNRTVRSAARAVALASALALAASCASSKSPKPHAKGSIAPVTAPATYPTTTVTEAAPAPEITQTPTLAEYQRALTETASNSAHFFAAWILNEYRTGNVSSRDVIPAGRADGYHPDHQELGVSYEVTSTRVPKINGIYDFSASYGKGPDGKIDPASADMVYITRSKIAHETDQNVVDDPENDATPFSLSFSEDPVNHDWLVTTEDFSFDTKDPNALISDPSGRPLFDYMPSGYQSNLVGEAANIFYVAINNVNAANR